MRNGLTDLSGNGSFTTILLAVPNEAVEKVLEVSRKEIFGGSKTIPDREIVQYSEIVKVNFNHGIGVFFQNDFFYSFNG